MKKTIIAAAALLIFANLHASYTLLSTNDSLQVSARDEAIGAGAAASGMGNAYIGAAQDAVSIFWNPAGMVSLDKSEHPYNMFFSHNMWLMNGMVDSLSVAKGFKNIGVFGAAVSYYNSGDMDKYGITDNGAPVNLNSKFSNYAVTAILSYANSLDPNIDFGINAKLIEDTIDTDSMAAFAFDLGLRYNFSYVKGLSINLVAKDFGGQFGNTVILKQVSLGLLYAFSIEDWNFKAEYDLTGVLRDNAINRAGIEVKTPYLVVLRAGYFSDNTGLTSGFRNFSFGAGLELNKMYNIDFSIEPYGELGNAYKMSFGADF